MKVKLLKKMRKRFRWWKEDDQYTRHLWKCYDRKLNEEFYCVGGWGNTFSYDDLLIREMMKRLFIDYVPSWMRKTKRRNMIYKRNLLNKHKQYTP